jgi:hypothetical protein
MRNTRKRYLLLLATEPNLNDNKVFAGLLDGAIYGCGVKPKQLLHECPEIESSAMYRWIEGVNSPRPRLRPLIIASLRQIVQKQLEK